jgi:hypothetical protein
MQYLDFKTTVGDLNTGATVPASIDTITKLVLGKIARLGLTTRAKTKEITVSGNTEWILGSEIPDFVRFKVDAENKCIYFYQSTEPIFLILTNPAEFVRHTEGGYAAIIDNKLKISLPTGMTSPTTLYVPYFSKYLVLDEDGTTEKENPEEDGDTFLFPSIFDDALVEGVLLYIKRRELNDYEFAKAVQEWEKSVSSLAFYQ